MTARLDDQIEEIKSVVPTSRQLNVGLENGWLNKILDFLWLVGLCLAKCNCDCSDNCGYDTCFKLCKKCDCKCNTRNKCSVCKEAK